ncbi:hypothetical protein E0I26_13950 [Flavobacterium rhamnosiphilum]|uniref:Uncharacterized protein n=1 Tax=Flavobacterium rhamnosiphilum TaxID=2541724 RepID=A0A4R5F4R7_9FLAO|nr:hypothetical protein [Flavobacterium rhamnosiphilum]TDE42251.1 hypothetical protein E0I26_13950 [Flavobacterium rhamnosiphilum]
MFKHLLSYTIEDISEIMNIPVILEIDNSINSREIEGVIVGYGDVSKSSTLPIFIKFEDSKGEINSFNLFDIKNIRKVD